MTRLSKLAVTLFVVLGLVAILRGKAYAPTGHWYTMIRITETEAGTVLTDVPYWRDHNVGH